MLPLHLEHEAALAGDISSSPNPGGRHRPVSSGPAARFEDDHRRLDRPPYRIRVESRIDGDPALPEPIPLLGAQRLVERDVGVQPVRELTGAGLPPSLAVIAFCAPGSRDEQEAGTAQSMWRDA